MRKQKLIKDFSHLPDGNMDQRAQTIVVAMTGNANFPTPVPALTVISTAITDYQGSMTAAASGDHTAIEIKNQKREELEGLLQQLGLYVESKSGDNAAILLSSGFKISKDPAPVGALPKPTDFKVMPSGKGEVKLAMHKIEGARIYQFEYKLTTATEWKINVHTKTKLLLTGLESGKEYNFRVVAVGASDVREYSDVINSFVF